MTIDTKYYKQVVELQKDIQIIKLEMLDLIKEVEHYKRLFGWRKLHPKHSCVCAVKTPKKNGGYQYDIIIIKKNKGNLEYYDKDMKPTQIPLVSEFMVIEELKDSKC